MSRSDRRPRLLYGTLDLLILRMLRAGPMHGHGITKQIQRSSDDALLVDHGSLYPALHRLEKSGCIAAKWEATDGRELRLYRLTPKGRKQLAVEESRWAQLVAVMARTLRQA